MSVPPKIISFVPAFEPESIGLKKQCAKSTLLWQYRIRGIYFKTIQSRHSCSPAIPMQNHMAISLCKIELLRDVQSQGFYDKNSIPQPTVQKWYE